MTAAATDWERHADGSQVSIPISPADADAVRAWCAEHCRGDFLIVLGPGVVFQRRDDGALATLFWRAEED